MKNRVGQSSGGAHFVGLIFLLIIFSVVVMIANFYTTITQVRADLTKSQEIIHGLEFRVRALETNAKPGAANS